MSRERGSSPPLHTGAPTQDAQDRKTNCYHYTALTPTLGPHGAGVVECIPCDKHWTASWPVGCEPLICPHCKGIDTIREQS